MPGQQQVYIVIAGDLVHKLVLEYGKTVAEAGDDAAPEIVLCLHKKTVRPFGRVILWQLHKARIDLIHRFRREDLVNGAKAALFDGQKLPKKEACRMMYNVGVKLSKGIGIIPQSDFESLYRGR